MLFRMKLKITRKSRIKIFIENLSDKHLMVIRTMQVQLPGEISASVSITTVTLFKVYR